MVCVREEWCWWGGLERRTRDLRACVKPAPLLAAKFCMRVTRSPFACTPSPNNLVGTHRLVSCGSLEHLVASLQPICPLSAAA